MLIISLNYSPVYSSHMYALYCAGKELNISIRFLCHNNYLSDLIEKGVNPLDIISYIPQKKGFLHEFFKKEWRQSLNVIAENASINCLIINPHPANAIFLKDYATYVGGRRFLWLHEPHKTFSELLQYGVTKGIYFYIALLIARWSVKNIEQCLLPSKYALNRFKKYYPAMANNCSLLPLMFPKVTVKSKQKLYFSFIGHVNKGKGIEPFLGLVEYSWKHNLKFQFQIISSTLSQPWLSRAKQFEGLNLKIINKDAISDMEISEGIASSFAVLCLYTTVTQSSVVANSMMQGTPVIASKTGSLPEAILNNKTGYLVEDIYDYASNFKLLELCITNKDAHQKYCLEEFEKNYSIDSVKPYLLQIIS
ncbi:MAG: glycosyltransferase [Dolichospermum sp. JUN01]|nr:glycosyltransferase [Dolichospermum sp. JUN01]